MFNATPEEAAGAIGAFVVLNDFSARDVQRPEMLSGFGPAEVKHFASSMSDTAVTADEILPRINSLTGSVTLNGAVVSTVDSAGMQHNLGEVLAHVATANRSIPVNFSAPGHSPVEAVWRQGTGCARGHPPSDPGRHRPHRTHHLLTTLTTASITL